MSYLFFVFAVFVFMLLVCFNNRLYQRVAYDVSYLEVGEPDSFGIFQYFTRVYQPESRRFCKSICVTSPVTTALELKPYEFSIFFAPDSRVFDAVE